MEADGRRLHSVLTRTEVHEKMTKEIEQISEVFSLSKSDATVILMYLRWNPFQVSDHLGDDKEKFLAKLGLVQVLDSNQNESITSCEIHSSCNVDDSLVSTPFCSHKYCTSCWRDYLIEFLKEKKKEKKVAVLLCPKPDCVVPIGPDTIEQLTESSKRMYDGYVLGSFMENNKISIKWCPAPGCDYVIERHEDDESVDFGVVCLCGHTFCWSCELESHRPVTCNNASRWCNKLLELAKSFRWISKYFIRCPTCNSLVHKNVDSDLRLVTCKCSYSFCYLCLRPEEEHNGKWNCFEASAPSAMDEYALTHHMDLWEAGHEAIEKARFDIKAIEQNIIPKLTENICLREEDIRALREAWMLVVQCSIVLKWSTVFGYFISDYQIAKKLYLDHLRHEATTTLVKHRVTVVELMNQAISDGEITCFKQKLEKTTTTTGNHFHFFVKTLEDGLTDVKVDAYENAPTSYWFCDRCTFQNTWDDKGCKMCFLSLESPPRAASENNNTETASAHYEQVPDQPNNSFALQEGTNP